MSINTATFEWRGRMMNTNKTAITGACTAKRETVLDLLQKLTPPQRRKVIGSVHVNGKVELLFAD